MPVWLAMGLLGVVLVGAGVSLAKSAPVVGPSKDRGLKSRPSGAGLGAQGVSSGSVEAALRNAGWTDDGVGVALAAIAAGRSAGDVVNRMGVFPLAPKEGRCEDLEGVGGALGGASVALALVPVVGPVVAAFSGIAAGAVASEYAACMADYQEKLDEYEDFRNNETALARQRLGL